MWGKNCTSTSVIKLHVELGFVPVKFSNLIFGEQTERHEVMNCTAARTQGYELHSSTDTRLWTAQQHRHKVMNCTAAQTQGYEMHSSTDTRLWNAQQHRHKVMNCTAVHTIPNKSALSFTFMKTLFICYCLSQ